MNKKLTVTLIALMMVLTACTPTAGEAGPAGEQGPAGAQGPAVKYHKKLLMLLLKQHSLNQKPK